MRKLSSLACLSSARSFRLTSYCCNSTACNGRSNIVSRCWGTVPSSYVLVNVRQDRNLRAPKLPVRPRSLLMRARPNVKLVTTSPGIAKLFSFPPLLPSSRSNESIIAPPRATYSNYSPDASSDRSLQIGFLAITFRVTS